MAVEHDRVGLGGVDDGLLPVLVHGRLDGRHHACAHLDPFGPERERRRHRGAVEHAAGGDDGDVDLRSDQRQQHHRGDVARVLEPAALSALDDQPVDAGIDGLERAVQRRYDMEDGQATFLELRGVAHRASG